MIVYNKQYPYSFWNFDEQSHNSNQSLKVKSTSNFNDFFASLAVKIFFKDVEHVYIYNHPIFEKNDEFFKLANLNYFSKINTLELVKLKLDETDKLEITNLRRLYVDKLTRTKLEITCKNVEKFITTNSMTEFQFNQPSSLIQIICQNYCPSLQSFTSLQQLHCFKIDKIDDNFLNKFSNNFEVHLFTNFDTYVNLIDQKFAHNKIDIKIYYFGIFFDLKGLTEIDGYGRSFIGQFTTVNQESLLKLTEKNLPIYQYFGQLNRLADKIPFIQEIDCTEKTMAFLIESNNFKRFPNIRIMNVIGPLNDLNQFRNFLSLFKINNLNLRHSNLDQKFFDQIYRQSPSLTHLSIKESNEIDLHFILDIRNLTSFQTDRWIQMDIILQLLNINKNLIDFVCLFKFNQNLTIQRTKIDKQSHFQASTSQSTQNFKNLDQLVQYLYEIFQ